MNDPKTTKTTLLVSKETLGMAILEALNSAPGRSAWQGISSADDTISDGSAMEFRNRVFTLLVEKFPTRLLADLSAANLETTDDLLADLYQCVEQYQTTDDDTELLTRIVTARQAFDRVLSQTERQQPAGDSRAV